MDILLEERELQTKNIFGGIRMTTRTRLTAAVLFTFVLVAIDWAQLMQLVVTGHLELEGNILARLIAQTGIQGLLLFTATRLLALYGIWRIALVFPRMSAFLYLMVALHVAVIANNAIALTLWGI
jgi:hypothetical protein